MKDNLLLLRSIVILIAAATTCACEPVMKRSPQASPAPERSSLFFPQLAATGEDSDVSEALLEGKLILTDRCIRIAPTGEDFTYLVVWPAHVTLDLAGETPRIVDMRSGSSASLGDSIRIGGGETPERPEQLKGLRHRIPEGCRGPIWLASGIVP